QHIIAFALLFDAVGKTAFAPLFNLIDRAAGGGDVFRHLFAGVIALFFCCIGFDDEQVFVDSHSSSLMPGARRLNLVMDKLTPSAIVDSAPSAARPMNSSRVSFCCRENRDN